MNDTQRDELLIRLDERTHAIGARLDKLPCDRCGVFFAILRLFGNRYALIAGAILFAIVASLAHADFPIVNLRGENNSTIALFTQGAHHCTLTRVIDGDTLSVNLSSTILTIRLIGIDTPETHHPRKPVQPFGPEATRFAILWLDREPLFLRFDPLTAGRDKYGRTLAYVFRDCDGRCLNADLLSAGLARTLPQYPCSRLEEFKHLEQTAQARRVGLWSLYTPPRR